MIGYVTIGTNDLQRSAAFYDALLAELGAKRLMHYGRGYFRDPDGNKLSVFSG
jgi:catechol 2,3-dioxygenase-like lactoylglutathione lyase family enzyme